MTEKLPHTFEQAILSAWQAELKAAGNPSIKQQCLEQESELLPRFAEHYQQLKALRRRVRRSLQRQWKRSLAGLALLLVLGQAPALAATINVGGGCTLVRAIVAANNDTTASGNCTKGSGADRIVLPSGSTQTLTAVNNTTPYGATGLPVIRSVITIAGNGSTIRRAGTAPQFRIFAVARTGNLTLQHTRVTGGAASPGPGGGIRTFGTETDGSLLTLTNSTVSGNTATSNGGGVYTGGGFTNVIRSTISGNTSDRDGGGVSIEYYSDLHLTNSTVSGNKAGDEGGGIYGGSGTTRVVLTHSTVSRNTADTRGGGVYIEDRLDLEHTLISGNTGAAGSTEVFAREGSTIFSNGFNLFGHSGLTNAQAFENFTPVPTDITATSNGTRPTALANILNPTLANNGGPTRTHALVGGSPAIDTVTDGTCPPPATDQRGVRRGQDGNEICDTGSFERRPRE